MGQSGHWFVGQFWQRIAWFVEMSSRAGRAPSSSDQALAPGAALEVLVMTPSRSRSSFPPLSHGTSLDAVDGARRDGLGRRVSPSAALLVDYPRPPVGVLRYQKRERGDRRARRAPDARPSSNTALASPPRVPSSSTSINSWLRRQRGARPRRPPPGGPSRRTSSVRAASVDGPRPRAPGRRRARRSAPRARRRAPACRRGR